MFIPELYYAEARRQKFILSLPKAWQGATHLSHCLMFPRTHYWEIIEMGLPGFELALRNGMGKFQSMASPTVW